MFSTRTGPIKRRGILKRLLKVASVTAIAVGVLLMLIWPVWRLAIGPWLKKGPADFEITNKYKGEVTYFVSSETLEPLPQGQEETIPLSVTGTDTALPENSTSDVTVVRQETAVEAGGKEAEKTTILTSVKNVFEELKAENKDFSFSAEARKIWEHAMDIEKRAEDFYREKAEELSDEGQKHILGRIADEEHRHWVTMQNVIQFLDRPNHWLEDAEWSNLEDY